MTIVGRGLLQEVLEVVSAGEHVRLAAKEDDTYIRPAVGFLECGRQSFVHRDSQRVLLLRAVDL